MTRRPPSSSHPRVHILLRLLLGLGALLPAALWAEPVDFDLPAGPADEALMAFSRQAKVGILFSFDDLHKVTAAAVGGRMEPEEALGRLLEGTNFVGRRNGAGSFVVAPAPAPTGSIRGLLLAPGGGGARGVHVVITALQRSQATDFSGVFAFPEVPDGTYQLFAAAAGFQTVQIDEVRVEKGRAVRLQAIALQTASDPSRLAPYVVQGKSARSDFLDESGPPPAPRVAIGDVDLPRTENDALDYVIFTRDQIARSGVTSLNEFLRTELLQSDATTLPPDQQGNANTFVSASSNLNLGGFTSAQDATIVLVDGRRLPEIVTALPGDLTTPVAPQPDVNVIPINLIERVEVLPVSASAIYSGSPVGGVINIVLRPNVNTTELTTTYTNAFGRFNAPQSTTSLLHGETLLGGRLHVRLNATFSQSTPPTEANLGYIRANDAAEPVTESALFRATPNVSSVKGGPLFGPGTPSFTSVAPGADGTGGLSGFAGREGLQDLALFRPLGGGLAATPNSIDYPYGWREQSVSLFGSVVYDVTPWLQFGLDAMGGHTVNNSGYTVFDGSLTLAANSPFNPFGQAVNVTLNETTPKLGGNFDEALIDYYSAVFGVILKPWRTWEVSLDAQYGLSLTRYRGLAGVDTTRWQDLVNEGIYNPLRDTEAYGPPPAFYQQAVEYYGKPGTFATLGDYDTFDSSLRISNTALELPSGLSSVTFGEDYRYARLASYVDDLRYGDDSEVAPPATWVGRSLQRISLFGEVQAPLLPSKWLPAWITGVETDVAARYTFSDIAYEANLAPTAALKVDFKGGFSLRATYATSNRFPPPVFSSELIPSTAGSVGTGPVSEAQISDPLRGGQIYTVEVTNALNTSLLPEAAVSETGGLVYEHGRVNRFRVSVDFVQTNTSGEEQYLDDTTVVALESYFPKRVIRAAPAPGDPYSVGQITEILTGTFNTAWRRSQNWDTSFDYAWTECWGGTLEAYWRMIYYQSYRLQLLPTSKPVDELNDPDAGSTPGLLRQRMNFGARWSNRAVGFGMDGHYFHSRVLPEYQWALQGSVKVDPYLQYDAFLQSDIGRLLPWKSTHYSLRTQIRVDNLFDTRPPRYAYDPSGAGVQSYSDWRGRIYSLSVTVTF